jgi:ABC-type transport system involved in cytochrome bd biosynthesis fused ATPase/permease subunit
MSYERRAEAREMSTSKLLIALMAAAMLVFGQFACAATTQARADYTATRERISADYKDAHAKCEPLTGHDREMCVVEARATERRAKASAEANYKGTIRSKTDSQIADANANSMVAKVACEVKAGPEKDLCVQQAEATRLKLVDAAHAHKTELDKAELDARGAREDTLNAQ